MRALTDNDGMKSMNPGSRTSSRKQGKPLTPLEERLKLACRLIQASPDIEDAKLRETYQLTAEEAHQARRQACAM